MLPYLREHHADPGRLHAEGHVTRVAIEDAREQVAARFGARPREVVFTATGTEAVDTAVFGARVRRPVRCRRSRRHVVTTAVEHSSVLDAVGARHRRRHRRSASTGTVGSTPTRSPPRCGPTPCWCRCSSPTTRSARCSPRRAMRWCTSAPRRRGAVVHVDACAAAGHVPVDFAALGADLCSVTAHKFGGPKGAAALLVRRGLRFPPVRGRWRAGTGPARRHRERARDRRLRRRVRPRSPGPTRRRGTARAGADGPARRRRAPARSTGVERYGDPDRCLPHLVCLGVEGVEAEPILLALDQRGVAVHSGSSCSSETLEPSPVLAGDGRRRRPLVARQRRLVVDRRRRRRVPRRIARRGGVAPGPAELANCTNSPRSVSCRA